MVTIILLVESKNVSINKKSFFEQPIKNKQEAYERIVEKLRNNC